MQRDERPKLETKLLGETKPVPVESEVKSFTKVQVKAASSNASSDLVLNLNDSQELSVRSIGLKK